MKITIAQLNPVVGDIEGNLDRINSLLSEYGADTDLLVFPELFLTGYPPLDLLERRWFFKKIAEALDKLINASNRYPQTGILVGAPTLCEKAKEKRVYNSAIFIYQGRVLLTQNKSLLPPYDLFNEAYYFKPALKISTLKFKGEVLGVIIGEDLWTDLLWSEGKIDPIRELTGKVDLVINIVAFPFYQKGEEASFELAKKSALNLGVPLLQVKQVGANDQWIFSGQSLFFNGQGELLLRAASFKEEITTIDTEEQVTKKSEYMSVPRMGAIHDALVLGIKDYFKKTGFTKATLGLSGGIDSAVVAVLAVEALGRGKVLGISMPSPFSSEGSIKDSRELANSLGIEFKVIPISAIYDEYLKTLNPYLELYQNTGDTTKENIQARIRGNIWMAFSNKYGYLVLVPGNKSELAVGYCTLYGDMSGGLSVISDLPKTMVYELAKYINREKVVIPEIIIKKAPSAELRPDQVDQDTLPPYPLLDQVLEYYIEQGCSFEEIVTLGFDPETVKWIIKTVNRNEYKRRQAVPGLMVTRNPLGLKRRLPVAAKF